MKYIKFLLNLLILLAPFACTNTQADNTNAAIWAVINGFDKDIKIGIKDENSTTNTDTEKILKPGEINFICFVPREVSYLYFGPDGQENRINKEDFKMLQDGVYPFSFITRVNPEGYHIIPTDITNLTIDENLFLPNMIFPKIEAIKNMPIDDLKKLTESIKELKEYKKSFETFCKKEEEEIEGEEEIEIEGELEEEWDLNEQQNEHIQNAFQDLDNIGIDALMRELKEKEINFGGILDILIALEPKLQEAQEDQQERGVFIQSFALEQEDEDDSSSEEPITRTILYVPALLKKMIEIEKNNNTQ